MDDERRRHMCSPVMTIWCLFTIRVITGEHICRLRSSSMSVCSPRINYSFSNRRLRLLSMLVCSPKINHSFNAHFKTCCLRIQRTLEGIRASEVPFRLPVPVCLPLRLAARRSRVRAREWTVVGLMMILPSLMSFLT